MADYKDSEIYKKALAGDADAMYFVGTSLAMGDNGFPKNEKQAFVWIKKAAEQENVDAQAALGLLYYEGTGVEKSHEKAVELFRQAADKGQADAQALLGLFYQHGLGVEKDYQKAAELYRKAVEKGNANAQAFLGFLYQEGIGVEKNYKEAVKFYQQAADKGNKHAQFRLGFLYQEGIGVEQSYEKAAEFFQQAADKRHANAQNNLGIFYHEGKGVEQNYEKAAKLLHQAAKQGFAFAQFYLGYLYHEGAGVEQSYEKAAEFFQQAAKKDIAFAQAALGKMSQGGEGVAKDFDEALKWLRKAYSNGFENAFTNYLVLDSFIKEDLSLNDCNKVIDLVRKLNFKVLEILQKRHNVKENLGNEGSLKVCHYTKYRHLKNMLEGKDKDREKGGDKSLLRMYNVRYCNDPTEGSYFFKQAQDGTALDYFTQQRDRIHSSQRPLVSTYILSLCDNDKEDNLNLWNLHGDKGHGVCLTLDIPAEDLGETNIQQSHAGEYSSADLISAEKNKDDDTKMAVYEIVYKGDKDEKEKEKEKYDETVKGLEKELAAIRDFIKDKDEKYKRVVSQIVLAVLGSLPYLYKDDFYRYDKEYRIIRNFVPGDHRLKADDRHTPPRLYYETNLGLLKKVKSGGKTKSPCTIILGYDMKDKGGTRDYLEHRLREICKDQPLPAITFSQLRY